MYYAVYMESKFIFSDLFLLKIVVNFNVCIPKKIKIYIILKSFIKNKCYYFLIYKPFNVLLDNLYLFQFSNQF